MPEKINQIGTSSSATLSDQQQSLAKLLEDEARAAQIAQSCENAANILRRNLSVAANGNDASVEAASKYLYEREGISVAKDSSGKILRAANGKVLGYNRLVVKENWAGYWPAPERRIELVQDAGLEHAIDVHVTAVATRCKAPHAR